MPQYSPDEAIALLVDAGLLTERQAEAFVLRRVEAMPGFRAAEKMGLSESTVSDYVSDAEKKISQARATADALDELQPWVETKNV